MQTGGIMRGNASLRRHTLAFWLFIAPCAILFTIFFLLPLFLNLFYSLTNYDGWQTMDFIGLDNYTSLLSDRDFYTALRKTFIYTLFSLPFKVILPLAFALLGTSAWVKAKTLTRTLVYIPVLLSSLVVGITINWMFGQEYGLINFLIQQMGGSSLEWALNPWLATFVISFASNWASTGFYMIIFIGGINNINHELYEAASIDGANGRKSLFHITLPMLSPTMFLVVLLSTINLLKEYALVQGVTQGGPGTSTMYIIQYIFSQGFDKGEYGYASAISAVVMILFMIIALVQFKVSKGGETE